MPTDDFETMIRALAARAPHATLRWALAQVDGGQHVLRDGDPLALAEWAFANREVMQLCADQKKINAIKLMRQETQVGLKEAKDAVELAWQWRLDGRMTADEIKQLEAEEQQAIASILGAS